MPLSDLKVYYAYLLTPHLQQKSEGEVLKRQSAALLQTAASDQRLLKALMDIESLKTELDKTTNEKDRRVSIAVIMTCWSHTPILFMPVNYI